MCYRNVLPGLCCIGNKSCVLAVRWVCSAACISTVFEHDSFLFSAYVETEEGWKSRNDSIWYTRFAPHSQAFPASSFWLLAVCDQKLEAGEGLGMRLLLSCWSSYLNYFISPLDWFHGSVPVFRWSQTSDRSITVYGWRVDCYVGLHQLRHMGLLINLFTSLKESYKS